MTELIHRGGSLDSTCPSPEAQKLASPEGSLPGELCLSVFCPRPGSQQEETLGPSKHGPGPGLPGLGLHYPLGALPAPEGTGALLDTPAPHSSQGKEDSPGKQALCPSNNLDNAPQPPLLGCPPSLTHSPISSFLRPGSTSQMNSLLWFSPAAQVKFLIYSGQLTSSDCYDYWEEIIIFCSVPEAGP